MNILVVIPARGGSKGIPRKNLRLLAGKPLIAYSIINALNSSYNPDVYVSSEDQEILNIAKKFKAKEHLRELSLATDKITLDPVIYSCYLYAQKIENKKYDFIITIQPTSPLLTVRSLDKAIFIMIENGNIETLISAKDSTHLSWRKENGKYVPNYQARLNRQYLEPEYTETGGFVITRSKIISENNRIGQNIDLYILNNGEEIDIDTYQDWNLCEYYLSKKHILFVVIGNKIVGLGHVYNTLLIANDILNHQISFLVDKESQLAFDIIKSKNFPVFIQEYKNIIDDIHKINPDIIINDILDTNKDYIVSLKKKYKVINFEDLGEGAKYADLVVNAIYPENNFKGNSYFGQKYFILRDEFILSKTKDINNNVNNILITFGGVDPNNYTQKVTKCIYKYCQENQISINIIAGFGYTKYDALKKYSDIKIHTDVSNISEFMLDADIIFTSAGRTVYEIASIGTPAIVLCQNKREMTHFFASKEYGFTNLGLGYNISNDEIFNEFINLVNSYDLRQKNSKRMLNQNLKSGRNTVNKLIKSISNT
tara:strand:- start:761 stop:2383 length:1623 start_codon:yes stop_codon:yes gene_type:complete